ncbi:MAG: MBL fold metallo-hydrolase [Magnetococcales bacterium]|nr:MBL fold metallo-hydrolase [Magnetococcales bacterium]
MDKGNPLRITRAVFQVGGANLTTAEDAASYLVVGHEAAVLVDAGTGLGIERLLANIAATGTTPKRITHLLLTHCHFDHSGGAFALRKRLGCRTVIHHLDAPYLETGDRFTTAANWYDRPLTPCPIDEMIGPEPWQLELEPFRIIAHHVPGHSPGSLVYTMESDGSTVMFAQDVHGPLHSILKSNRQDYRASLQRMLDLNCDVLCEGHYGIIRGKKESAAFIRSFMSAS